MKLNITHTFYLTQYIEKNPNIPIYGTFFKGPSKGNIVEIIDIDEDLKVLVKNLLTNKKYKMRLNFNHLSLTTENPLKIDFVTDFLGNKLKKSDLVFGTKNISGILMSVIYEIVTIQFGNTAVVSPMLYKYENGDLISNSIEPKIDNSIIDTSLFYKLSDDESIKIRLKYK